MLYIRLNAEARRSVIENEQTAYPPQELFSDASPLVIGTAAEGDIELLSQRLVMTAERALTLQPELGEAYFIRAWGNFLVGGSSESVIADLARAAELLPDDEFVKATYDFVMTESPTGPNTPKG